MSQEQVYLVDVRYRGSREMAQISASSPREAERIAASRLRGAQVRTVGTVERGGNRYSD
jgi:hypothetical protein